MINLKFELVNPFSERWANIYNIGGYLTKNKSGNVGNNVEYDDEEDVDNSQ